MEKNKKITVLAVLSLIMYIIAVLLIIIGVKYIGNFNRSMDLQISQIMGLWLLSGAFLSCILAVIFDVINRIDLNTRNNYKK